MKLSEAMREGIKKTAPYIGTYFGYDGDGKLLACALGAAWIGEKGEHAEISSTDIASQWPELDKKPANYPENASMNSTLWWVIVDLNDSYEWDRERIADWLEQEGY